MPELAEVEYFRKLWSPGEGHMVTNLHLHPKTRVFRGQDIGQMEKLIPGTRLVSSQAKGKQMLFRFEEASLGVHLGMTGALRLEAPDFSPGKHDHLVIVQKDRSLVFSDPRLFGRILFHEGRNDPEWWSAIAPDLLSKEFTKDVLTVFLQRRKSAPIKAVLLMQERFPGVGNWMADEILWRSKLSPSQRAGDLEETMIAELWKNTRGVCREALKIIGTDWGDPPDSWLFPHRWQKGGSCPRCGLDLRRDDIGGRTTCWCPKCQPASRVGKRRH